MQQFSIAKENVLCLVVDNASNMTKAIERLNKSDPEADPSTANKMKQQMSLKTMVI